MTTIEQAYTRYDTATLIRIRYLRYISEFKVDYPPWRLAPPYETVRTLERDVNEFQERLKRTFMRSLKS